MSRKNKQDQDLLIHLGHDLFKVTPGQEQLETLKNLILEQKNLDLFSVEKKRKQPRRIGINGIFS